MAGGFSFPPPPPPPPKRPTAPSQPHSGYDSQQGVRGGNARGDSIGRGVATAATGSRASASSSGGSNFIPLGSRGRGSHGNASAPRGGRGASTTGYAATGTSTGFYESYLDAGTRRPSAIASLPPGSHVNPRFLNGAADMSGSVSMQALPARGSQDSKYQNLGSSSWNDNTSATPQRTPAGHKRKLDALRGSPPHRDSLPTPPTVPAVPSFNVLGSGNIGTRPNAPSAANIAAKCSPHIRPGLASLGLVPRADITYDEPEESDKEGEDVDEEAQYAELGTRLTFEHNGEVVSLNNAADLAAWREERRKAFPTSTRVANREDDRRRMGEERRRLLADAHLLYRDVPIVERRARAQLSKPQGQSQISPPDERSNESPLQQVRRHCTEGEAELGRLRKSVKESQDRHSHLLVSYGPHGDESRQTPPPELLATLGVPKKNAITDPSAATNEYTASPATDSASDSTSEVSSDTSSSESDSDNDEPPESTSSRPKLNSGPAMSACRYFAASGYCRDGDACRFRHELSAKTQAMRQIASQTARPEIDRFAPKLDAPMTTGKKSIHERLVEQEQTENDRLTLKAIKALGEAGFFRQPYD